MDKNLILESHCNLEDAEFLVLGVPFDSTTTYRPGTRFGPLWIRKELLELEKPEEFFRRRIVDVGNLVPVPGNLRETNSRLEEVLSAAIQRNPKSKPVILGGEHSLSYPAIKVLKSMHPNLQVLHFDAHPDLMDTYLGEKWSHATVMRRIYELGVRIVQVGVRVVEESEKKLYKKLPRKLSNDPVYISIDMDVFDPSLCPGVGNPEPGGLSLEDVLKEISKIRNMVGFDIVETNPLFDSGDITSITAAKIFISLVLSHG